MAKTLPITNVKTASSGTILSTGTTATTAEPSRVKRNRANKNFIITEEKSKSRNDDSCEGGMLCDCVLQFLCACF